MPTWLIENPTPAYIILGLAALGFGFALWVRQEKKFAVGLAIVIGLMILIKLLDTMVVSDHEKIVLSVQEMAGNVKKKDVDRIFAHISDRFDMRGIDKKRFRAWVEARIRSTDVTDLKVWEFEKSKSPPAPGKLAVLFLVKAQGDAVPGETFFRCEAYFVKDPDNVWRLSGFRLMDPQKDPARAEDLPLPVN